ncbi:MAG: DUF1292 domain-containing protein [Bacilli bacterium]|nr:DUF1292 domain-containing protein [Bacilli bacterium]
MGEKEMITIQNSDNSTMDVELITYLISDDKLNKYLVYSKGEKVGDNNDEIIYISKLITGNGTLQISEIVDDNEWLDVQKLLKRIANA